MNIRRADAQDVEASARILEEATAWLAERGLDAWEPGTFASSSGWGRTVIAEAQRRGDLWVAWAGGRPVATVTLQWSDAVFWPGAPHDAGYVHRLAVAGNAHGQSLGSLVLAFAERRALSNGKRFLRLDCLADGVRLRRYYEEAGFLHVGDVEMDGRRFSLYQKRLSPPGD